MHGAFELANAIHPGARTLDLPNPVDPRGALTFGVTALAVVVLAWTIVRMAALPHGLGCLGFVAAILLLVIYLGRLIVSDPMRPILLIAALLAGFVVNPLWYAWLGVALRRPPGAAVQGLSRPDDG